MKPALPFIAALLLVPPAVLHAAETFLVENGEARSEIIIAEKAPRSTRLKPDPFPEIDITLFLIIFD